MNADLFLVILALHNFGDNIKLFRAEIAEDAEAQR